MSPKEKLDRHLFREKVATLLMPVPGSRDIFAEQ